MSEDSYPRHNQAAEAWQQNNEAIRRVRNLKKKVNEQGVEGVNEDVLVEVFDSIEQSHIQMKEKFEELMDQIQEESDSDSTSS